MRHFSFRPALTLRGRTFKGLRGWSGKPLHPPLTDVPIGAYVLAAVFDVISLAGGSRHAWSREFFHAATYAFVGGAAVSLLAALTGTVDWLRSSEPGTQARRTINAHALVMVVATAAAVGDVAWRLASYHTEAATPAGMAALSLVVVALGALGATYGGTLVFDYGFNVETAGDHAVWHRSEEDVFPGGH